MRLTTSFAVAIALTSTVLEFQGCGGSKKSKEASSEDTTDKPEDETLAEDEGGDSEETTADGTGPEEELDVQDAEEDEAAESKKTYCFREATAINYTDRTKPDTMTGTRIITKADNSDHWLITDACSYQFKGDVTAPPTQGITRKVQDFSDVNTPDLCGELEQMSDADLTAATCGTYAQVADRFNAEEFADAFGFAGGQAQECDGFDDIPYDGVQNQDKYKWVSTFKCDNGEWKVTVTCDYDDHRIAPKTYSVLDPIQLVEPTPLEQVCFPFGPKAQQKGQAALRAAQVKKISEEAISETIV